MRAIVQRVSLGSVRVDGLEVGRCGRGLLLLVGVHRDDTTAKAEKLAEKIVHLRIFSDSEGRMNLALVDFPGQDTEGPAYDLEILAVSNFTVYGNTASSRRPSYTDSAPYDTAKDLFDHFVTAMRTRNISVQTGVFGANMEVSLINDGPVTVIVDV